MNVDRTMFIQPANTIIEKQKVSQKGIEINIPTVDFAKVFAKIQNDGNSYDKAIPSKNYDRFVKLPQNKGVPYSELADESGQISYNGVTFQCDYEHNALCLGDMSNEKEILTIPLSGGGTLKVNRNSLNDLSKAIGMFTPEDVKRILAAIATDKKAEEKKNEMEGKISETIEKWNQ